MGKVIIIAPANYAGQVTELGKLLRMKSEPSAEDIQMEKILEVAMEKAAEMEADLFEKGVRENAIPRIRGEITPDKMKRRGITRCYNRETGESWLEQKGNRITEIFRIVWK